MVRANLRTALGRSQKLCNTFFTHVSFQHSCPVVEFSTSDVSNVVILGMVCREEADHVALAVF